MARQKLEASTERIAPLEFKIAVGGVITLPRKYRGTPKAKVVPALERLRTTPPVVPLNALTLPG